MAHWYAWAGSSCKVQEGRGGDQWPGRLQLSGLEWCLALLEGLRHGYVWSTWAYIHDVADTSPYIWLGLLFCLVGSFGTVHSCIFVVFVLGIICNLNQCLSRTFVSKQRTHPWQVLQVAHVAMLYARVGGMWGSNLWFDCVVVRFFGGLKPLRLVWILCLNGHHPRWRMAG